MPAKEGQPIAQLIGGGPQPRHATFIEGAATRDRFAITMRKLDGTVLQKMKFKACAHAMKVFTRPWPAGGAEALDSEGRQP